jgi:hypothetical protein
MRDLTLQRHPEGRECSDRDVQSLRTDTHGGRTSTRTRRVLSMSNVYTSEGLGKERLAEWEKRYEQAKHSLETGHACISHLRGYICSWHYNLGSNSWRKYEEKEWFTRRKSVTQTPDKRPCNFPLADHSSLWKDREKERTKGKAQRQNKAPKCDSCIRVGGSLRRGGKGCASLTYTTSSRDAAIAASLWLDCALRI